MAAATALHSKGGTKREKEEARYNEWDDVVGTTGSAMLGLTVACARCHDHKYDPISAQDYYRLVAAVTTTVRVPAPPPPVSGQTPTFKPEDRLGPPLGITDGSATPTTSYLLGRGDVEHKTAEVTFGFPAVLTPPGTGGAPDRWFKKPTGAKTTFQRTALAEWMTDAEHGAGHLLARVIVNRLWQHHFGEGIVRTPSDFGLQGERPTHPELLDWLAAELIRAGWRLKPIHRLMMASAAYRQDATFDEAKAKIDPENRLLWRRRPVRAGAEVLRDSILAASGKLDRTLHGPSIKPFIPPEAMAGRNKDGIDRPKADGPDQWRRSIYLFTKRSLLTPGLTAFDAPSPTGSCARRTVSTVAPQALFLLNDPFVRRQATAFAERCLAEAKPDPESQVRYAYEVALSREPSETELSAAVSFLGGAADKASMTDLCHVLFGVNEFVYVD